VVLVAIAVLTILRELDVDIMPILTGAGILGLAVGFGAQTLVRDIISGFFLILEDQVRVGDVAAINGTGGLVEAINLRTIVLRDLEGTVHIFPNGSVTTLTNRSKDFSFYVIDSGSPSRRLPLRLLDDLDAGAGAHARGAGRDHRLQALEVAHAAGGLHAHLGADDAPHQRDVGHRGAAGAEARWTSSRSRRRPPSPACTPSPSRRR
jgi:hypothetical protein